MRIVLLTPRWGFEESAARDDYESPFREDMPDVIVVETETVCESHLSLPQHPLPKDSMDVWMDMEIRFTDVQGRSLFKAKFPHGLCLNFLWTELTGYEKRVLEAKDDVTCYFDPTEPDGRMESTASGDVACVIWVFDAHHYLMDRSGYSLGGFYIGGLMDKDQYFQFVKALQNEAVQAWQALFAKRTQTSV